MRRVAFGIFIALSCVSVAWADITCAPTQPLAQQNRTRMKHRTPPNQNPGVNLMTVAQIVAASPAAGINSPGARTSVQPIDPRETSVLILKGDLWAINIEPNDCDFHLEVSEVGGSVDDDRVIVEIPQTVQVLGFGFYDAWHFSSTNPQRGNHHGSPQVGSLWEIHPVWAIIFPIS